MFVLHFIEKNKNNWHKRKRMLRRRKLKKLKENVELLLNKKKIDLMSFFTRVLISKYRPYLHLLNIFYFNIVKSFYILFLKQRWEPSHIKYVNILWNESISKITWYIHCTSSWSTLSDYMHYWFSVIIVQDSELINK